MTTVNIVVKRRKKKIFGMVIPAIITGSASPRKMTANAMEKAAITPLITTKNFRNGYSNGVFSSGSAEFTLVANFSLLLVRRGVACFARKLHGAFV